MQIANASLVAKVLRVASYTNPVGATVFCLQLLALSVSKSAQQDEEGLKKGGIYLVTVPVAVVDTQRAAELALLQAHDEVFLEFEGDLREHGRLSLDRLWHVRCDNLRPAQP